jgi:uncharacterized protein (DUF697 family)
MIDDLAEQFGKNYTEDEGRHTLAAVTGGMVAPVIAAPSIASAVMFVPVVGPLVGVAVSPATSAISTRLIGHLAVEHFERDEKLAELDSLTSKAASGSSPVPAPAQ